VKPGRVRGERNVSRPFKIQIGILVLLGCVSSQLPAENVGPMTGARIPVKVATAMFEAGKILARRLGNASHGSSGIIRIKFYRSGLGATMCE